MKSIVRGALAPLYLLYGFYALLIWCLCLFFGGALVLMLPGLQTRRRVARRALRIMFFISAMPYRFKHLERLPDGACVVIANHRSYLDGLVLIAALPPGFRPVIKQEVAGIPVIYRVLKRVGSSFVQRTPTQAAGRDTLFMIDALRAGDSLAVFPEGSFSPDPGLLPFRTGAFLMAAKAGVPVAPVVMRGTRNILPEGRIVPRPGFVEIDVLDPVRPDGDDRAAAKTLRDRVEQRLQHVVKPDMRRAEPGEDEADYYRKVLRGRPLPVAYLDLDLFEHNVRATLERSGGKRLRVDGRVLRCPGLIERLMRSNARLDSAIGATAEEAVHLAREQNVADTLLAYPTVVPAVLDHVCQAIAEGHAITLTVDSPAHLRPLSEAAARAGVDVPVCVEMDTSVSVLRLKAPSRRTPIRTVDALLEMAATIEATEHMSLRGVFAFDTRRNPLLETAAPRTNRKRRPASGAKSGERLRERRRTVVESLREHGHEIELFNTGGDASMQFNAHDASVTEITVGAALYGLDPDDRQDVPAAGYAAEIMRQPGDTLYACLSPGYTTFADSDPDWLPQPYLPRGARLDGLAGAGQAQLPIRYAGDMAIGDTIFMHPANAGELCDRFSSLLLIQDGKIVDELDTYRALGDLFVHRRDTTA